MDTVSAAADHHVRVMEARIEKQKALVQQLEAAGADPAEQIRRLDLLVRALEEMRIQLGNLSSTELDAKRSDTAIALRMLSEPAAQTEARTHRLQHVRSLRHRRST